MRGETMTQAMHAGFVALVGMQAGLTWEELELWVEEHQNEDLPDHRPGWYLVVDDMKRWKEEKTDGV